MGEPLWSDDTGPIKDVWKGMPVIDIAGLEVGQVEFVKMGDPEAATTRGQSAQSDGLMGSLRRLVTGGQPDTARQQAEHLQRIGFVKVDGKGVFDRDVYVAADQIAAVVDGSVQLSVGRDDLVAER